MRPTPRFLPMAAALLLAVPCASLAASPPAGTLTVPGRLSDLASAVGIDQPLPRARVLLEIIRVVYAQPYDAAHPAPDSPYARLAGHLAPESAAGGARSTPGPGAGQPEFVPAAIPADAWRALLGRKLTDEEIGPAILRDRRAALLYYGLAALDDPTRALLVREHTLLARIYAERAGTFATMARGLRIEDGRIALPGGTDAAPLWARVAGEPPSRPSAFVERLFWKDEGRLAYFYDTLAHLDAGRLAFALGAGERDANARLAQFERLYRSFSPTLRSWQPELRPFYRTTADAADLLYRIRATPEGALAAPAWRGLWEAVFESDDLSQEAARSAWNADALQPISAAHLVELVCVPEVNTRFDRFRAVLLGQHAFRGATPANGPDLVTALRGTPVFWSLALTLDRMDVVDPAIYAVAMRRAASFGGIEDPARRAVAISQFQGALALLERARFARTLDAGTASKLASDLVLLPLTGPRYGGLVAHWFDSRLLPVLEQVTGAARESVLLAALAGRRAGRPAPERLAWEGADYKVDVAEAEFGRLAKIAASQLPQPVEIVLSFSRAARHAATLQNAGALASFLPGLLKVSGQFQAPQAIGLGAGAPLATPTAVVKSVLAEANDVSNPRPGYWPPSVAQIALPLLDEADALVAEALAALAYIPALGDPARGALLLGRVPLQHDLLLMSGNSRATQARGAWLVPEEVTAAGTRWHVKGSLLGVDLALARLTLREIVAEQLPPPPTLAPNDARAFAEAVALCNPFAVTDEGRDRIAAAIAEGRRRVKAASADPDAAAGLARLAGAGGWRIEGVRWSVTHAPGDVEDFFALSDLLRIGGYQDRGELDAWGASGLAWNGLAFAQFAEAGAWETYAGRLGTALLAARLPDPVLRVAEALAERRLPASLLRGVLAAAMQDFLDEVRLAHPDDWLSAARCAAGLRDTRFDDYVAALTWNGPLIPDTR